jgi:two-component system, chemotaxis family, CheB/CheR fusion protein
VKDNTDSADMLATVLRMDGHEVKVSHDGAAALRASLEWHPEVVLLDIGLPGMDGYEVARRIRQERVLSGVTLVALTGYGQKEDLQRKRLAGFDYHLVKPVDMAAMKRLLDKVPVVAE